MGKQQRNRANAAPAGPASSTNRLLLGGTAILGAVLVGVAMFRGGVSVSGAMSPSGGANAAAASSVSSATQAGVRVISGGIHTVRHTVAALPSAATPRADGRPTLVWFSGTWCEVCESMEPYASSTFARFDGRMAFAEKSVDHDRAASTRFAVRGTPTFVLIDAQGRELSRFFYQPTAARLQQAVDTALKQAGF